MKNAKQRSSLSSRKTIQHRIELGRYVVVDPEICHGKPTYKGTRVMVWQVLAALERGESADEIVRAWDGKVTRQAIAETVRLAREALLDHEGRLSRGSALAA
jgi:uncharacterized protein (DUF433 family)